MACRATTPCQNRLPWSLGIRLGLFKRASLSLQVREVAQEAIARARRGDGPTLIEAETYRFRGHSLADPDELRKKEEKDHYQVQEQLSDALATTF